MDPCGNVSVGKPFTVTLGDIEFDTMNKSILLESAHLIQQRITKMSLQEIRNEAESRNQSLVRGLTESLSLFMENWWQFDLRNIQLDITGDSIRKTIAISHLLVDIPGISRMFYLDPEWIRSRDVLNLTAIERASPAEAIDFLRVILNDMSVQEMDEKRAYIRELGMIVYEKQQTAHESDRALQQISDTMPSLPDEGRSVSKRQIVMHSFEGIMKRRYKQTSLIKRT